MQEPIVLVTTLKMHEGKLPEVKEAMRKALAFYEKHGPQLLMGVYIDEENLLANGLQVHRDSESILATWKVGDPYMRDVMQYTTTTRVEVYGRPNDAVMEGMKRLAGMGAHVTVKPLLVGFSRLPGAAPA